MACHWNYDTKGNKIAYGLICGFWLIAKCLIAAGVIGGYTYDRCIPSYNDCTRSGGDTGTCTDLHEYCKIRIWINLIVIGVIVWLVGLSFSSYMCCFSKPPERRAPEGIALMPAAPSLGHGQYPQMPTQVMGVPVPGYIPGQQPPYHSPLYPYPHYPQPSHTQPAFLTATVSGTLPSQVSVGRVVGTAAAGEPQPQQPVAGARALGGPSGSQPDPATESGANAWK